MTAPEAETGDTEDARAGIDLAVHMRRDGCSWDEIRAAIREQSSPPENGFVYSVWKD